MMHFFRRSTLHLDCFTAHPLVIRTAPIERATKFLPEWWKNLPDRTDDPRSPVSSPTMKKCAGFLDYYSNSLGFPLWCDLGIKIERGNSEWAFADNDANNQIRPHDPRQYTGFLSDGGYMHHKITSPWLFRTKQDVNWVLSQPLYNYNNLRDFSILPGILNFKHQMGTNIQLMLDVSKDKKLLIPAGQLLANFTPLTDKKIKIHRHLVGVEEFFRMDRLGAPITFVDKYKSAIQRGARFKSCPFSNHTKDIFK